MFCHPASVLFSTTHTEGPLPTHTHLQLLIPTFCWSNLAKSHSARIPGKHFMGESGPFACKGLWVDYKEKQECGVQFSLSPCVTMPKLAHLTTITRADIYWSQTMYPDIVWRWPLNLNTLCHVSEMVDLEFTPRQLGVGVWPLSILPSTASTMDAQIHAERVLGSGGISGCHQSTA